MGAIISRNPLKIERYPKLRNVGLEIRIRDEGGHTEKFL